MNRHSTHDAGEKPERKLGKQTDQTLQDPYQVLGLSRQATADEIKKAYFARVREFPPEREPETFKRIRAAYDALRTPEAKAATDLFLVHPFVPLELPRRLGVFDISFHEEDWLLLAEAYSDLGRVDFRDDYRDPDL
jgi:curved DNA-binding protein CbpA